jgi:hypothetical protein
MQYDAFVAPSNSTKNAYPVIECKKPHLMIRLPDRCPEESVCKDGYLPEKDQNFGLSAGRFLHKGFRTRVPARAIHIEKAERLCRIFGNRKFQEYHTTYGAQQRFNVMIPVCPLSQYVQSHIDLGIRINYCSGHRKNLTALRETAAHTEQATFLIYQILRSAFFT